jgi:hypothetical protein
MPRLFRMSIPVLRGRLRCELVWSPPWAPPARAGGAAAPAAAAPRGGIPVPLERRLAALRGEIMRDLERAGAGSAL